MKTDTLKTETLKTNAEKANTEAAITSAKISQGYAQLPVGRAFDAPAGFYLSPDDNGGGTESTDEPAGASEAAAGKDGENGKDGESGKDGGVGKDGATGANGEKGKDAQVVININRGNRDKPGTPGTPATPAATAAKETDKEAARADDEPEFSKAYVESLRREAREAKEELKKTSGELSGYKKKDMDALELAQSEAKEATEKYAQAQKKLISQTRDRAIDAAIGRSNSLYPDVIATLVEKADVPIDDDGNPDAARLKRVIEDIKKDKPGLFKSTTQGNDAGAGRSGGSAGAADETDMNTVIRNAVRRR